MAARPTLAVVIPALNEEATIGDQVAEVLRGRRHGPICRRRSSQIIVVDNGSEDRTAGGPARPGPRSSPSRAAAMAGPASGGAAAGRRRPDRADGRRPQRPLRRIAAPAGAHCWPGRPIWSSARARWARYEPGSLLPQQLFGNWVAARLLRSALRREGHRHRPLPGHPAARPARAGHARDDLRLVGGDDRPRGAAAGCGCARCP